MENYIECPAGHIYDVVTSEGGFCPQCQERRKKDDAILEQAAADYASRFDPKHPNAVDRYLNGEELD